MMSRSAIVALMIALPAIAAGQDTAIRTGSINRVDQAGMLNENQVRDRLTKAGYIAIGTLDRDSDGIWRTTAMKGDKMLTVAVNPSGAIEDR